MMPAALGRAHGTLRSTIQYRVIHLAELRQQRQIEPSACGRTMILITVWNSAAVAFAGRILV